MPGQAHHRLAVFRHHVHQPRLQHLAFSLSRWNDQLRLAELLRVFETDAIDDRLTGIAFGDLPVLRLGKPGHRLDAKHRVHVDALGIHR